jgi:proteasome lid subunit RPN8/RPN11
MSAYAETGALEARPRMSGGVRRTALPLLRDVPDPATFVEHVTTDGRRVFLAKRVLDDLARLERTEHPDETGGLLFGGYFSDGVQRCAIVTQLVEPEPGEVIGTPSTVTITAAGSERMIARAWRRDPLLRPVGWGHTHPCFEAYFSGVDRNEQRTWQEAAAVGLVISGLPEPTDRYRVFVGPESTPAEPVGDSMPVPVGLARGGSAPQPQRRSPADGSAPRALPRPARTRRWLRSSRPVAVVAALLATLLAVAVLALSWQRATDARDDARAALSAARQAQMAAQRATAGPGGADSSGTLAERATSLIKLGASLVDRGASFVAPPTRGPAAP